MVETSQKEILQRVTPKAPAGKEEFSAIIGANFEDIIDTREGKDPYTLAQFYDAVMDFFKTVDMFCYTTDGEKPKNSHMKIWIDNSETNQDHLAD